MNKGGGGREVALDCRISSPQAVAQIRLAPLAKIAISLIEASYGVERVPAERHVARFEVVDDAFVVAVFVGTARGGGPSAANAPRLVIAVEEQASVELKELPVPK